MLASAVFIVLLGGGAVHADELEAARGPLTIEAGLDLGTFVQEGHAPPLCCGERDSWTAVGTGVRATIGYDLWRHLRISASARYAFQAHFADGAGADRIHVTEAIVGVDAMTARYNGVVFGAGVLGAYGRVQGTFPRESREATDPLRGLGLRMRFDIFPIAGTAGLAVEGAFVKYAIVQHALTLGASLYWPL